MMMKKSKIRTIYVSVVFLWGARKAEGNHFEFRRVTFFAVRTARELTKISPFFL